MVDAEPCLLCAAAERTNYTVDNASTGMDAAANRSTDAQTSRLATCAGAASDVCAAKRVPLSACACR